MEQLATCMGQQSAPVAQSCSLGSSVHTCQPVTFVSRRKRGQAGHFLLSVCCGPLLSPARAQARMLRGRHHAFDASAGIPKPLPLHAGMPTQRLSMAARTQVPPSPLRRQGFRPWGRQGCRPWGHRPRKAARRAASPPPQSSSPLPWPRSWPESLMRCALAPVV
jgi:hypothetical protein